jgi:NAD(P)H-flavin reductase
LYFVDRFMRSYSSWFQETKLIQLEAAGNNITRVVFEKAHARSSYRPGQYVFVAFSGSVNGYGSLKKLFKWANWHPMTISETYHLNASTEQDILENQAASEMLDDEKKKEGSITSSSSSTAVHCELNEFGQRHVPTTENDTSLLASLHIKTLGNYTERLCELASTRSEPIKLRVDGPFGAPLDIADQPVFVAVSTGVGITPSLSFVKDLVDRRSLGLATVETHTIHFVWSVTNEGKIWRIYIAQNVTKPNLLITLGQSFRAYQSIFTNPCRMRKKGKNFYTTAVIQCRNLYHP